MTAQATFNTLRTIGIAGSFADGTPHDVLAGRNDDAGTGSMAFGHAVSWLGTSDEQSFDLLTAITGEIVAGIILRQPYADTQLDTVGVIAGNGVNVVRKGRMYVICEDGCSVGDRLHVRAIATGDEIEGALLAAADGSDTIDSTKQGQWLTSVAAGGVAVLDFDFTREID